MTPEQTQFLVDFADKGLAEQAEIAQRQHLIDVDMNVADSEETQAVLQREGIEAPVQE